MSLFSKSSIASSETKAKIIRAISENKDTQCLATAFSKCDFALIPTTNESKNYHIWAAQYGDVTIMVWERGNSVENWVVKTRIW